MTAGWRLEGSGHAPVWHELLSPGLPAVSQNLISGAGLGPLPPGAVLETWRQLLRWAGSITACFFRKSLHSFLFSPNASMLCVNVLGGHGRELAALPPPEGKGAGARHAAHRAGESIERCKTKSPHRPALLTTKPC